MPPTLKKKKKNTCESGATYKKIKLFLVAKLKKNCVEYFSLILSINKRFHFEVKAINLNTHTHTHTHSSRLKALTFSWKEVTSIFNHIFLSLGPWTSLLDESDIACCYQPKDKSTICSWQPIIQALSSAPVLTSALTEQSSPVLKLSMLESSLNVDSPKKLKSFSQFFWSYCYNRKILR